MQTRASASDTSAIVVVIEPCPSRSVARNRLGRVVTSPSAVTIGVETESRSQPRRVDAADRATVITRIKPEPIAPPTTAMINSWLSGIDGCPAIAADDARQDRDPQRGGERREHRDHDVAAKHAAGPQVDRQQTGGVGRAQAGADRAEDRAAHPDGGRDQDVEAGELGEGAGEVREGQTGDEARRPC